ncbi:MULTISPECIES: hypothetical protein [Bacillota]|uniref:hypothetical protein n=1 Tax=Bacillota TaxID=1239 RepID=UPI0039EF034A
MYAEYRLNARSVERRFQREVIKKGYYLTAKGCINRLIDYRKTKIIIATEKGEGTISISRKNIRKAISYFYFKRTAVREDFSFCNYTSAIFAIVYACFSGISKLQILKNGLYRLSMKGTRFFASGLERDPFIFKTLKELGGKYVLYNYKNVIESPGCLEELDRHNMYCLIDSGAFTLFNERKKLKKAAHKQQTLFAEESLDEMVLEGYAKFINENMENPRILGFFPLDCVGNPEKTKNNYRKLVRLAPAATIYPVWQCTDSVEELNRLVSEEHEMIGIGGLVPFLSKRKPFVREILAKVTTRHPNVNWHALGVADELLMDYGIFSADSTAFLNARKYAEGRRIYLPSGERVKVPNEMDTIEIIKQNLLFLIGLEKVSEPQLSFIL